MDVKVSSEQTSEEEAGWMGNLTEQPESESSPPMMSQILTNCT